MKIVHLNTHSYGGAAIVARRLHLAGLAAGIDSQFITQYGLASDRTTNYAALRDARLRYALRQQAAHPYWYRVGKFLQRRLEHRNLANRPAGFEIFSPLNTRQRFADCAEAFDPNIIHLHWVAGFVDHADFFARNRQRKFVWTLHDMNPLTGGCHHADGCTNFTAGCAQCPQLAGTVDQGYARQVFAAKAQALAALADDQLVIATPSRWLMELSRRSPLTERFRHVHIRNPALPGGAPQPDRERLKGDLNLPGDRKIVLFVSDNLRNPRKGIDLLLGAADMMARKREIQLVGIGNPTDTPRGVPVRFTGRITEDGKLAAYYSCADVLVNPSVMENSPLTIIEALSLGTPAVAFDVGGVRELIGAGCGALVTERSAAALATTLENVLFHQNYDRAAIQQSAAHHEASRVWQEYQNVYSELLTS
ncbi:MAG TPA: glycosyltransferase [Longimicrobiales bacterium]|nr:glycosyltransferase [Longimicrobiales bacterium]